MQNSLFIHEWNTLDLLENKPLVLSQVKPNFGHILSEDPVNWILHLSVEKSSSADPYLLSDKKWP